MARSSLLRDSKKSQQVSSQKGKGATAVVPLLLLAPLLIFMVILFIFPFLTVIENSFTNRAGEFSLDNYQSFADRNIAWRALLNTLIIGVSTVVLTALVALPYAYLMKRNPKYANWFFIALFMPLLINGVIRVYGFQLVTRFLDTSLTQAGFEAGFPILYTLPGVVLSLVTFMFPQMTISIYASLERMDDRLVDAAESLGGKWKDVFRHVVFPAARPGLVAGSILTFAAASGSYLAPAMVGGGQVASMPTLIYSSVNSPGGWGFGAAVATILMAILLPVMVFSLIQSTKKVPQ